MLFSDSTEDSKRALRITGNVEIWMRMDNIIIFTPNVQNSRAKLQSPITVTVTGDVTSHCKTKLTFPCGGIEHIQLIFPFFPSGSIPSVSSSSVPSHCATTPLPTFSFCNALSLSLSLSLYYLCPPQPSAQPLEPG
jgi:hypothetical protein